MTPDLETRRLLLLPPIVADAEQIQRIFPQWEIVKYLGKVVPWPYPPDGAMTFLRDQMLPSMKRGDGWAWTIRLKAAPARIIGFISLHNREETHRGFWIVPEHQGQGLMTEACNAVTDFWFNTLNMLVLRVPKAVPNIGSRRISEKQGMRLLRTEERDFVSGRYTAEIWEITAKEWNARR
ncbi:GNAT family N-acetyltransferase [Alloacidobacterium dinghuense]|uniref:GNAT family N-acetyltransferase n=2 Tax=Alloacidobacterium dinghuense TaxID=2763107 RepID=A0A7G8BRL4_9BACT|nr:GNAT family N-acetyltransferase [Alloacidobacterium dinghuense]